MVDNGPGRRIHRLSDRQVVESDVDQQSHNVREIRIGCITPIYISEAKSIIITSLAPPSLWLNFTVMATDDDCITATTSDEAPTTTTTTTNQTDNEPLQLGAFAAKVTAEEAMSRTARYAKDPKAYLEETLGQATLSRRKVRLSIPTTVDKDTYGTGTHKKGFEDHLAKLLGKAHGLFFITGVQAQLAALKIYCDRAGRNLVAWHVTSHLETAEEKSYEALYGLRRVLLGSDPKALPTVSEIKEVLDLPSTERPVAIVLEIPNRVLGCKTYTFAELETISKACKDAEVAFHCDGARLWEIEPYYEATSGKSFADLGKLFDSVYVSFYKGLRGVTGSALVHDDETFINEAKVWQRRAGGNAYTLMYEIIDCERGYNENIGVFPGRWDKMKEVVEGITLATAKYKDESGRPLLSFMPSKPLCCQVHTLFHGYTAEELIAARDRVQETSNVRLFERLWGVKTVDERMKDERASAGSASDGKKNGTSSEVQKLEWMISDATEGIDTNVFVNGYVALCEELLSARQVTATS